jgi:NAD(P)-dependent dehydrogenase (short-subunit alcohol dehydrogenase family)
MHGNRGAVLVTGASKGIGLATVKLLARHGFQVYAGVRKESDARAIASTGIHPVLLDVTDGEAIARVRADLEAKEPRGLAGLVNNAGMAVPSPLELVPLDELRRQMEVNLIGQLAVTQAFVPLLRKARGRIVNIGSIGDRVVQPMAGAYHMSKYALAAMNDTLRLELRGWGIDVVLVEPGAIATPIWDTSLKLADDLLPRVPGAIELYGSQIEAARADAKRQAVRGAPPDTVARAILTALTTRRPKTRYLVGPDAKIISLLARLPDRIKDRLIVGSHVGRVPEPAVSPTV